jgi:hypothetical protein
MKVSGWKTNSIFRRYDIVDTEDVADAINKVQAREEWLREQARCRAQFGHNSEGKNPEATIQ